MLTPNVIDLEIESEENVKLSAKLFSNKFENSKLPNLNGTPLAILIHPWSVLGGRGLLMEGLGYALSQQGICAISFDLRGVNASTGRPTLTGKSEVNDVIAVCNWAHTNLKSKSIVLIGSSAGSAIAGSAIDSSTYVKCYVGIGYLFGFWVSLLFGGHHKPLLNSKKPKLFIHGSKDEFTSVSRLESYFNKIKGEINKKIVIPNVGHFQLEGPDFDYFVAKTIIEFMEENKI